MSASFELPEPSRVTVGTVGVPGARTFFLQARQGEQLVTLKLEKQQVAALAALLRELLADLPTPEDDEDVEAGDLEEPALAEWAAGTIQLAYDGSADRVVLLIAELSSEEDEEELEAEADEGSELGALGEPLEGLPVNPSGGLARLAITRAQAIAIIRRGIELVEGGRPICPLCGYPMDPAGHSCPRTNGHRPPSR